MLPNSRLNISRLFRSLSLTLLLAVVLGWAPSWLRAEVADVSTQPAADSKVLTSFGEFWELTGLDRQRSHRVRLEYDVYYYDPLWKMLWGRCGKEESYVSFGSKVFPIKVGQRIRIEGQMHPARGMLIEDPRVEIVSESVLLEAVSTTGDIANIQKFSRRLVTVEGYVDTQTGHDADHLEMVILAEDQLVGVILLLHKDGPLPQLQGKLVRAKGVYSGKSGSDGLAPKIELWIQRKEDVQVIGSLDRDPRFTCEATDFRNLPQVPADTLVRVVGTVVERQLGKSLTLRSGTDEVTLQTAQTLAVETGDEVEAIGFPGKSSEKLVLNHSLYRRTQPVYTDLQELWDLPVAEREKPQRAKFEFVVHHYDAGWKALWGRTGATNGYISLGETVFPIKQGQKILIEGLISVSKGPLFESPTVTVLEENVPLVAMSTTGHIDDMNRFNKNFVSVEGYVDRQFNTDRTHIQLDLIVEGRPVTARLMVSDFSIAPKLDGALLRIEGVYSATFDPASGNSTIEIWTSGIERVQTLGWLDKDPRFALPQTPIDQFAQTGAEKLIRVEGAVRTQRPGKSVTIRDETGQTTLLTSQSRPVRLGERVEAIGYPVYEAGEWKLRDSVYRISASAPPPPTTGLPKLRLADQLRELQPTEAARSYPVQLTGVVTWSRPGSDFVYIRDASGGVCVLMPADLTLPGLGSKVEVTGVSAPGNFTPVVLAASVVSSASMELPEPRQVTLEQALTGIEEAQWVTMSGYVRAVGRDGAMMRMDLTTSGGEFQVVVAPHDRWAKLIGSVIRVRGVCSALANSKRQLTGIQVWMASSRFFEIEEPAPSDPFSVAERSIASLRQFSSLQALNRRVRVAGVVVHQSAGRVINLQEGTEGLLVLSRDTLPLEPGDRIEAVGFPGRERSRLVLREAVYRKVSSGDEPTPLAIERLEEIDEDRDGLLARVQGTLVDTGAQENGSRLILQNGSEFFEASIDRSKVELPDSWVPGSQLELTGVYEIEFDEYRRPHAVRLQLRNFGDVRVLRRPSILTVRRVLAVTSALAICVVLGVGWVLALRRRVHQQTGVIRDQLEKEKAARLDAALARASKLESVGVLAGGIAHDFNNLLTVVIGNVSLAKMDDNIEAETIRFLEESEKAAARAKDLTQQLLTFAKGGEPVRISTRLPDIVQEATQFGLHGSKVRSEFEIAPDLWPADVDKGQIAQVVNNLIINASQAMPAGGLIRIVLRNDEVLEGSRLTLAPGRYVRLSISDTGVGIAEEFLTRIFEPYFTTKSQGSGLGLASVYSIVKKHQGHIDVQSKLGTGTTFNVWLPAAQGEPVGPAPTPASKAAFKMGRVLLMDDEVSIRQLSSAVIKRMGLEVTAVNDGAAVVSEYAAATAAGRPYDLVILDLTVPGGMGGAEAMQRLRTMDDKVRAIVSSGYSSDPVMANHVVHGFCGRVPKPYTATELTDVVSLVMKTVRA